MHTQIVNERVDLLDPFIPSFSFSVQNPPLIIDVGTIQVRSQNLAILNSHGQLNCKATIVRYSPELSVSFFTSTFEERKVFI